MKTEKEYKHTFDKKAIMKEAWNTYRTCKICELDYSFARCLRDAWKHAKKDRDSYFEFLRKREREKRLNKKEVKVHMWIPNEYNRPSSYYFGD